MSHKAVRVAQILWPAFLMACVLEMLVFGLVDPSTLHFGAWEPERKTVYSLAFMLFWALSALATGASYWMSARSLQKVAVMAKRARYGRRRSVKTKLAAPV